MSRRRHTLRSSNEGWLISYADLITNLLIFFSIIVTASKIQTGRIEQIAEALSNQTSTESLTSAAEKIKKKIREENLDKNVRVDLTDEGLELSFDSGVIFNSASAEILPPMQEPLTKVLQVIKPYSEKYFMAIEGHTDHRPINSSIYQTNWELASARSLRLRRELTKIGIHDQRIRIEAYADTKPLEQELLKGLTEDEILAKHRRVVIRLF